MRFALLLIAGLAAVPVFADDVVRGELPSSSVDAVVASEWKYADVKDDFEGTMRHSATLRSQNENMLSPPFGASRLMVSVNKHPKFGLMVMFYSTDGILDCARKKCAIRVKFDDAEPQTFNGVGAGQKMNSVVFIDEDAIRLVNAMKASKSMTVRLAYYRDAQKDYRLNPFGLVWD